MLRPTSILIGAALVVGACAAPSAAAPGATKPPTSQASAPAASAPAATKTLEITAFDLGFTPATLDVPAPGKYEVKFVNTGATVHDITFATGESGPPSPARPATGRRSTSRAGGTTFICSIPGHAEAGMRGRGRDRRAAAPHASGRTTTAVRAPSDDVQPIRTRRPRVLYDATAPSACPGQVHDIDLVITEEDDDRRRRASSRRSGRSAGPCRARSSGSRSATRSASTSRTRPTNQLSHSIDFHASQVAWNDEMTSIEPGEEKLYEWTADYAGVWMYHCGTAPALHHIANGMYGMVIVEPKDGLPKVDNEFALVQSEWYLGPQGEPADLDEGVGRRAGARLRRLQRRRQPVQGRTRSRSRPASACGSSSSTPGRTSTARSTSSARSSTPSSRKAST